MSDFLGNLAIRSFAPADLVLPRPVALFEPLESASPAVPALLDLEQEREEATPPAVPRPRRPPASVPDSLLALYPSAPHRPEAGPSAPPRAAATEPAGVPQDSVQIARPPAQGHPEASGSLPVPSSIQARPETRAASAPIVEPLIQRLPAEQREPAPVPHTHAAPAAPSAPAPGPHQSAAPLAPAAPGPRQERSAPHPASVPSVEPLIQRVLVERREPAPLPHSPPAQAEPSAPVLGPRLPSPAAAAAQPAATPALAGPVVKPQIAPEARPVAPPAPAAQPSGPPPTIQVTIGRIEVRAAAPAAREPKRAAPPATSLDEYLRQRNRGGSR